MSGDPSHNEPGLKSLTKDTRQYIEKRLELFVLSLSEQISRFLAGTIHRIIGIVLLYSGFLFVWAALGWFLGDLVENTAAGFLVASLPLLLAGFMFTKLKPEFVIRKIQTEMVQDILKSLDGSVIKEKKQKREQESAASKGGAEE